MTYQARNGLLSLTIHGAKNLTSHKSSHSLHPVALIRLPACSRVYQTRSGDGFNPVWKDEFDLVVSFSQSINPNVNDYTVYDIDEEFEDQSNEQSINHSEDYVVIEVIDNLTDRAVLGRARISFDQIEKHQSNTATIMSITLENNAGVIDLSASWTDKPTVNQSVTASPSYEKRGRFLISDGDYQSNSDKSIDQISNSSSVRSSDESAEEISATASTNTNLTSDQPTKQPSQQLTVQSLLDRRSSSHESKQANYQTATQSVSYSFPILEDTYTKHSNRHVASFLPTLTTRGLPFWHSTGRHGLLYDDSTTFDDRNFLNSTIQSLDQSASQSIHTSVCEIRVWSRDFIHGIQITYAFGNGSVVRHFSGPKHVGRVHTTEHVLKLHHSDGEYVIGVEGTYREWVETLTIITNKRAHTFGGNVDARATKWRPAGSPKLPTSFRCDVPPGHRVVAFQGGYGVHLHNIGVAHAPIAEGDLKRKHEGLFSNLKKKFSHNRLDTLVADH